MILVQILWKPSTSGVLLREGRPGPSLDLDGQDTERKLLKMQLFSLAAWRHRTKVEPAASTSLISPYGAVELQKVKGR